MNESVEVKIRPQADFPWLQEYKYKFAVTDKTIFAGGDSIYTNYPLRRDIYIHEVEHLKQQAKHGLVEWVYDFLEYPEFRLKQELGAYRAQLRSIKDRNQRNLVRIESAQNLSSALYGSIISYQEAFEQLKV